MDTLLRFQVLDRLTGAVHPKSAIVFLAIVFSIASFFVENPSYAWLAISTACALLLCAAIIHFVDQNHQSKDLEQALLIAETFAVDALCFVTDRHGNVLCASKALGGQEQRGLSCIEILKTYTADPDSLWQHVTETHRIKKSFRLSRALRNQRVGFKVERLSNGLKTWMIELSAENSESPAQDTFSAPVLTLARNDTVLFTNRSALELLGDQILSLSDLKVDAPIRLSRVNTIKTKNGVGVYFLHPLKSSGASRDVLVLDVDFPRLEKTKVDVDSFPIPLMRLTNTGQVVMANREAGELTGSKELIGKSLTSLFEGLGRPVGDWLDSIGKGESKRETEFLKLKSGDKETFLQVTLERLSSSAGGDILAVLNDATELKTLETKFVQSQKMQAIGELAGGVAHDFNNLLTAITGHCDLLLLGRQENDEGFADLTQISQNANRAASLVGQLLAFSRKQTLQPEDINLSHVVTELSFLLKRLLGARYEFETKIDDDLPIIRVDKQKFEQVIVNLVVNARDAMPEGGSVSVSAKPVTFSEPLLRDRASVPIGDYVELRVKDTGIGIKAENVAKVFEPFFSTKPIGQGTGLGLSMVYGSIKQSGGFVFLESEVGVGTEFVMYFPAIEETKGIAGSIENNASIDVGALPDSRVLLVEDEPAVRAFAARALQLRGVQVIEASNGEDALDIALSDPQGFDLIVSDVIMPGLDGPTWVEAARKTQRDTPVVFMSGYSDEKYTDLREQLERCLFLSKPFSLSEFSKAIDQGLAIAPSDSYKAKSGA